MEPQIVQYILMAWIVMSWELDRILINTCFTVDPIHKKICLTKCIFILLCVLEEIRVSVHKAIFNNKFKTTDVIITFFTFKHSKDFRKVVIR